MADVEMPAVVVKLSVPAATFLRATIQYINEIKTLPTGEGAAAVEEAFQTSAWLEEIEAQIQRALAEAAK